MLTDWLADCCVDHCVCAAAPQFFGDLQFVGVGPVAPDTIKALTFCELVSLSRPSIAAAVHTCPELEHKLLLFAHVRKQIVAMAPGETVDLAATMRNAARKYPTLDCFDRRADFSGQEDGDGSAVAGPGSGRGNAEQQEVEEEGGGGALAAVNILAAIAEMRREMEVRHEQLRAQVVRLEARLGNGNDEAQ